MPPDGLVRLEATVRGSVQGVGFRAWVRRRASALGLVGWVANRPDGSVECVAEGARADLDALMALLQSGPPGAWVERVDPRWGPAAGSFTGFDIRAFGHPGD